LRLVFQSATFEQIADFLQIRFRNTPLPHEVGQHGLQ
jgi:hypothetical protein